MLDSASYFGFLYLSLSSIILFFVAHTHYTKLAIFSGLGYFTLFFYLTLGFQLVSLALSIVHQSQMQIIVLDWEEPNYAAHRNYRTGWRQIYLVNELNEYIQNQQSAFDFYFLIIILLAVGLKNQYNFEVEFE